MKKVLLTVSVSIAMLAANAQVRVNNAGNVGIGTTNPNAKLQVEGVGSTNIDFRVNGRMSSDNTNGGLWCGEQNTFVGGLESNKIGFWNQGWRFTVRNNGNIGIGTTNPGFPLSFGSGYTNFKSLALFESGPEFYGLGISGCSFDFWIGNNCAQYRFRRPDGSVIAAITASGDIWGRDYYSRGQFLMGSDKRLKENINQESNALDKILALRGVSYQLKDSVDVDLVNFNQSYSDTMRVTKSNNTSKKISLRKKSDNQLRHGFIAQELEQILPELVQTNDKTGKAIDYIGIIPILVEAFKEQNKTIETLQAKVSKLEGKKASARKQNEQTIILETISGAYLYQNVPNPFNIETQIRYFLPESVKDAFITVTDLTGKQIKSIVISTKGESFITIKANQLNAGFYVYALIADGQIIDTKRMVIIE